MEGAVVTKIAELAETKSFVVGDKTFTSRPVHEVKPEPFHLPARFLVHTLAGLAELISQKIESMDPANYIVQIDGYNRVSVVKRTCDEHGRRLELIVASPVEFEGFPFGRFMTQEDFIIQAASRFSSTADLAYVVDVASGITTGASRTAEDDGLAQKVTVKRGMSLAKEVQVRNRVSLAPYRIFPECQQPVSEFLFRLRGGSDSTEPLLALFEADGGKWKIAAVNEIKRYLSVLDLGVPIIA